MVKIMKSKIFLLVLLILLSNVYAENEFIEAEELIRQKIHCESLTDDQLELMGDYYMEQLHPGERHEFMDRIMGGEGSVQLRQVHIIMARSFYCGESKAMSSGMMNVMMGRTLQNGGMMNMMWGCGYGFGNTSWFGIGLIWLFLLILVAFIFGIIFWWTYKIIMNEHKGRK